MRVCEYCGSATPEGLRRCPSCRAEVGVGSEKEVKKTANPVRCPRCEGEMLEGFLASMPQVSWQRSILPPIKWHAGPVRWSNWWGYQPGEVVLPVRAYRCEGCGLLEFYAKIS